MTDADANAAIAGIMICDKCEWITAGDGVIPGSPCGNPDCNWIVRQAVIQDIEWFRA